MNAIPAYKPTEKAKVIELATVMKAMNKNKEVRLNKDGTVDKRHCNKVAGMSSEVYPFTEEEVKMMMELFNRRIIEAPDDNKQQIAARNKLMFVLGLNLGLRASDLCSLQYSFFINEDGKFKEYYSLMPKKTQKSRKFVKLYFNEAVQQSITNYMEDYCIKDLDEYIFKSRKGNSHLTERAIGEIIKTAAEEVGITKNVASHSMRKAYGKAIFDKAEDKEKALVLLMMIFNHSSTAVTRRYIGITTKEIEDAFMDLNLGLEDL